MARLNTITLTLCALFLTTLSFAPLTQASGTTRAGTVQKQYKHAKASKETKSKKPGKKPKVKSSANTVKTVASGHKNVVGSKKNAAPKSSQKNKTLKTALPAVSASVKQICTKSSKHGKRHCVNANTTAPLSIADAHKLRVHKARQVVIGKLMDQLGKPYHWGGASPRSGFDCSGLVYYAYKDVVKMRIPRTANEMYHLRDASTVNLTELQSGDLVFFRTRGRGTADHVGVYVGGGKFIQSPRSGRDIEITSLSEDYWQRHYIGARRVMTSKTIR